MNNVKIFAYQKKVTYLLRIKYKTIFSMTIAKDKTRREVHLNKEIIDLLQKQADEEGRSLKNLMEIILIKYAKKQST